MKKTWIVLGVVLGGLAAFELVPHFLPGVDSGVILAQQGGSGSDREAKRACQAQRKEQLKATREEFRGKLLDLDARAKALRDEFQQKRKALQDERKDLRKQREERFKSIRDNKCS